MQIEHIYRRISIGLCSAWFSAKRVACGSSLRTRTASPWMVCYFFRYTFREFFCLFSAEKSFLPQLFKHRLKLIHIFKNKLALPSMASNDDHQPTKPHWGNQRPLETIECHQRQSKFIGLFFTFHYWISDIFFSYKPSGLRARARAIFFKWTKEQFRLWEDYAA